MEEDNSEVGKMFTSQEVEDMKTQLKKAYEDNFDKNFNKRWGKQMNKFERENAKTNELVNLLKEQTGRDSIDDLLNLSYEQYGVERPESERDSLILGKHDAQDLIELDDLEEIEREVERLANQKRNAREEAEFSEIESYLNDRKKEERIRQEIKDSGIDESVLEDDKFKEFTNTFKEDTPITTIYDFYSKMNKKEKPFSAGSLTGSREQNKNEIKDYYTYEESLQFSREDFDRNPELFKAVEKSMPYWTKRK
jgi:hypothetical protein